MTTNAKKRGQFSTTNSISIKHNSRESGPLRGHTVNEDARVTVAAVTHKVELRVYFINPAKREG
jgi:hypothetical protein